MRAWLFPHTSAAVVYFVTILAVLVPIPAEPQENTVSNPLGDAA